MRKLMFVAVVLGATAVWAWQYEDEISLDQVGARAGGGGYWATGGKQESGVTCVMCHVPPAGGFPSRIGVGIAFSPMLAQLSDGGSGYSPGTTYTVNVTMNGEHLGFLPDGGNTSHNMMAATFENTAGAYVGKLTSDTGFTKGTNCPQAITMAQWNAYAAGTTTVSFNGCDAVTGYTRGPNGGHKTAWKFTWLSPAVGTGQVRMYWGVTDGSGDETTLGDDTLEGIKVLEEQ